jgi:hypothetical protein
VAAKRRNNSNTSRRTSNYDSDRTQQRSGGRGFAVLFWVIFIIVIVSLFAANKDRISQTLRDTQFMDRIRNRPLTEQNGLNVPGTNPIIQTLPPPPIDIGTVEEPAAGLTGQTPLEQVPEGAVTDGLPGIAGQRMAEQVPAEQASSNQSSAELIPPDQALGGAVAGDLLGTTGQTPAGTAAGGLPGTAGQAQAASVGALPGTAGQVPAGTPSANGEYRERAVYFTQVDRDGMILRTKVIRRLPASGSPLLDTLQALLAGPNAEEQNRGLITLIPEGTRLLSAAVRGSTAYLSFSEDFQYNTYGIEGYVAQLRQLIWTTMEFSNIKDVQILIEGRRVDFLGESIWIGSPVNRDTF